MEKFNIMFPFVYYLIRCDIKTTMNERTVLREASSRKRICLEVLRHVHICKHRSSRFTKRMTSLFDNTIFCGVYGDEKLCKIPTSVKNESKILFLNTVPLSLFIFRTFLFKISSMLLIKSIIT